MNVLLFGATGMIGQGVLRECLAAGDVARVATLGRTATGVRDPKLVELTRANLLDFEPIADALRGFDACFFCLGATSAGMSEADYARLTHDVTLAAAQTLARLNPDMTFVFVSGAGADSSEKGRVMWARIKGKTENALFRLPFKAAYAFRPGVVQPLHGARSKTASYRVLYGLTRPLLPLLRRWLPNAVLTTETMGRAMLAVARKGYPRAVLEARDINAAAGG